MKAKRFWMGSAVGTLSFVTAAWFGMSTMDYTPEVRFYGMSTAFWFVFGLPLIVAFGFGSTLPFCWIYERGHTRTALFGFVFFYTVTVSCAVHSSLPKSRLKWALNGVSVEGAELLELQQVETFNDGFTVWAKLRLSSDQLQVMAAQNELQPSLTSQDFETHFTDDTFPDMQAADLDSYLEQTGYRGRLFSLFYDPAKQLLFVQRRSAPLNP